MINTILYVSLGLVLHSAFDYKQSHSLLSPEQIKKSDLVLKKIEHIYNHDKYDKLSSRPRLMIYYENTEDITHKFIHYNFTMVESVWGSKIATDEKIAVFKEMRAWLNKYNQTLKAFFENDNDLLAWHVASYDSGEHHFD